MSAHNQFRHQAYVRTPPTSPYRLLPARPSPAADTVEYRRRFNEVAARWRAADVAGLYLVHGTFVGSDALGTLAELTRLFPETGAWLAALAKQFVDSVLGDVGNYTEKHVRLLSEGLKSSDADLPVRLFTWSSQNDHIGRADAAVRLIDAIAQRQLQPTQRLLLWGHSHAGNVFALMTNLLAGHQASRDRFFRAARSYYRWPIFGWVDVPVWERVRELLESQPVERWLPRLDLVTFGTPIRYGWDTTGCARLLHFINHRPAEKLPDFLAPFPPTAEHVLAAYDGDYVQQMGIAGTNLAPSFFAWRTWLADWRLDRLLEANIIPRQMLSRIKVGARVPADGETLLVDYGPPDVDLPEHHAGHAVYTRPDRLLFHAEEVTAQYY